MFKFNENKDYNDLVTTSSHGEILLSNANRKEEVASSWLRRATKPRRTVWFCRISAEFCRIKTQIYLATHLYWHQNHPIPPFNSLPFNTKTHPTFHSQDSLRKLTFNHKMPQDPYINHNVPNNQNVSTMTNKSKSTFFSSMPSYMIPKSMTIGHFHITNKNHSYEHHELNMHIKPTLKNQLSTSLVGKKKFTTQWGSFQWNQIQVLSI